MKKTTLTVFIILLALALFISGCGRGARREPLPLAAQEGALLSPPVQQYPPPAPKTEGSLFSDQAPNYYTDVRAFRVGDIVTINVVENARASKRAKSKLQRDSTVGAGLTSLLGYQTSLGLKGEFEPQTALDLEYQSKYKGEGQTERTDTMTAQISARIIQVLPNGHMVIRGSREVTVNYETQIIVLQGVVRPEDISPDNTVQSSYIADARIDYIGDGDVVAQQRKGWGTRFLDFIWPF